MNAKRGRPVGTKKRSEAKAAAQAIWNGEFEDVRSAATFYRPPHVGSDEGFRDFISYVEEAYRELMTANNIGSMRRYNPLSERTSNRQSQTKPNLKYVRKMLNLPDPI